MPKTKNESFKVGKKTQTKLRWTLDSAEELKNSTDTLESTVLVAEAQASTESEIDLEDVCNNLRAVHARALIVQRDIGGAIVLIEEDLEDCLEALENQGEEDPE